MKRFLHSRGASSAVRRLFRPGFALAFAVFTCSAPGATIDWSSTAATTAWGTAGNWDGLAAPANDLTTDIARFNKTSYLNQPTSGTRSINGLQIGDGTTATATLTLTNTALSIGNSGITMFANAGAATLTGGSVKIGASQTWSNNSSNLLTINSAVTNIGNTTPFTLTLNGSGTGGTTIGGIISNGGTTGTTALIVNRSNGVTTLSGVNTYTGGTTLTLGTLKLSGSGTLGSTNGALTVNGGTLDLNGTSQGVGNLTGSGGTILNNSTGTNITFTIGNNNATGGNYSGVIADHTSGTGTIALTKTGTGTLTLSGANTYTGVTSVSAGVLNIQNSTALGTTAAGTIVTTGEALQLQGGIAVGAETLTLDGTGASSDGALRNISENNSWAGAITINSTTRINSDSGTLTLDVASGNAITGSNDALQFGGAGNVTINDAIATGTGTLTKDGTGTLTLSGASTYTGATTVTAGILNIQNATGLGTIAGGVTVNSGATLQLQNGITVGAEALDLSGTGASGQNGALVNAGGTNNYGGLLNLSAAATISSDSGTLNLTNAGTIVGPTFGLTLAGAGDGSLSSIIGTTSGTLTKSGAGSWTLSGANTYTGGTTLTLGTLKLSGSGTLGSTSGALTVNGGTLDLNGTSQGVGNLTGSGGTILNNSTGTNITFTIGNNNATGGDYSGVIADHTSGTGTLALTKTGTGTLTLSGGTNTFTGGVTLNAGTLSISSDANLGASSGGITFGGGTLASTNNVTSSRAVNMTGAGSFNAAFGTIFDESGVVSGNGNLTVSGNGILILSGSGSNGTGTTTINGGVLALRGTVSLGSGNLAFATGVLELGNSNFTRALGTLANQANMSSATGGAGFAAYGADRIVNLGGSGATVTWNAGSFVANGQTLYLGTPTADHMVDFQNSIALAGGTRTITVTDGTGTGADAQISGVISGTGASNLVISAVSTAPWNPGTLILSGANTYIGTTTVSAGTLNIQNATGLGTTAAGTAVASGATLQLQGGITVGAEALNITGAGANGQTGALVNVSGTNNFGGLLTLAGAATLSSDGGALNLTNTGTITGATFGLTLAGAGNGSISSIIGTTSGSLTKNGTGSWTVSGVNTYTGGTTINGGTLVVNSSSSLGAITGGLTINAGTLEIATGYSTTRTFTLGDAASTFQVDASQTFTDTTAIGGSGSLNKTGTGIMVLGATETYGGSTNVSAGTLQINASERIANGSALTVSGGSFDVQTFSETVAGVTLSGGSITGSGAGTLTGSSYSLQSGSASAVLAGSGAVSKTTAGTVTLTGVNTLSGAITVSGGTLSLAGASGSALGSVSSVTVNSGGTLLLGATDQINNSAAMSMGGGTFAKGNFSEGGINTVGIGALTLTATGSHIDFGTGTIGILTFASLNPNTFTLTIDNWTGNYNTVGTGSSDRLIFDQDQSGNLSKFYFTGYGAGGVEFNLGGGYWEVVAAVPEPSTWVGAGLSLAALVYCHVRHGRRRLLIRKPDQRMSDRQSV